MTTKQLRQKILDLAIHGKLVKQDANDEPASTLLARIRAEKEQLVKDGKLKKKDLVTTPVSDEDKPFEVSKGWEWCRLGDLAFYKKGPFGSSLTKSMFVPDSPDSYKVYEQKNAIQKDESLGNYFITKEKFEELKGFEVYPNDIIVSCAGTIGETYVMPDNIRRGVINQALMLIRLHLPILQDFYLLYFDFFLKEEAAKESKGTAIKNIPPFDVLKNYAFPLPPLAEQHRIVAAVEQWMSLVDIIESGKENLQQSIALAKNKILDLAIKGKLVEKEGEWEEKTLASISTDSADGPFGSNLKREHYTLNKEVRIIQLSNIGEEGWRDENTRYTTFEHLPNIARSEVHPGDIVIAKMMPAGRAILCPSDDKKYVLSSDAVKFVLKENVYDKYVLNAINSSYFREQVYDDVQGVTRVRTSLKKLREYIIPLPPLSEQHRIVAKIEELFTQLDIIANALK